MRSRQAVVCSLHDHALELPASSIDRPQRLVNAMHALGPGAKLNLPRRKATADDLARVHDRDYVTELEAACAVGARLDPELVLDAKTFAAASAAAGALIEAVESPPTSAFALCLSRPGSHHAGRDYALGFCVVNNLAVAAAWALDNDRAERVAILDFDAHHGNGTEEIFYADPRVLTVSIHQFPFFPGSGDAESRGAGAGLGRNLNLPLAAGAGHDEALEAFDRATNAINDFEPDLLLLEAGLDAHVGDWTSELAFEDETFFKFGVRLAELTESARIQLVAELGGGYTEEAVSGALAALIKGVRR